MSILIVMLPSEFMKEHPHLIPNDNGMEFLSDDGGETYNHCHCELFLLGARLPLEFIYPPLTMF